MWPLGSISHFGDVELLMIKTGLRTCDVRTYGRHHCDAASRIWGRFLLQLYSCTCVLLILDSTTLMYYVFHIVRSRIKLTTTDKSTPVTYVAGDTDMRDTDILRDRYVVTTIGTWATHGRWPRKLRGWPRTLRGLGHLTRRGRPKSWRCARAGNQMISPHFCRHGKTTALR
jgi:hypothetical protein